MITPTEAGRRASQEYAERLLRAEQEIDARMREHGCASQLTIHLRDAVHLAFRYAAVGWDVDVDHRSFQTELVFRKACTGRGVVRRVYRTDGVVTSEELTAEPLVYAAHGGWADEASTRAARRVLVGKIVSTEPIVHQYDGSES